MGLEPLTGKIDLGSEAFVVPHQPNRVIRDIPRRQTQAHRPTLRVLFQRNGEPGRFIHTAYRQYGSARRPFSCSRGGSFPQHG